MNRYQRKKHKDICKLQEEVSKIFSVDIDYDFAKKLHRVMYRMGNIMLDEHINEITDVNVDLGPIIVTSFELHRNNDPHLPYTFGMNWILKNPQFVLDMEGE